MITPENKWHVRHMLVHLCEGLDYTNHSSINVSYICDEFPEDLDVCRTSVIIADWAVGGEVSDSYTFVLYIIALLKHKLIQHHTLT